MTPDFVTLSVVVTTFNRRALLARCLRSLAEQDFAPEQSMWGTDAPGQLFVFQRVASGRNERDSARVAEPLSNP